MTTTLVTLTFY